MHDYHVRSYDVVASRDDAKAHYLMADEFVTTVLNPQPGTLFRVVCGSRASCRAYAAG